MKDTRESTRRALPCRLRAVPATAVVAIATPAALATRGILPRSAALAPIPPVVPRVGAVLARVAARRRGDRGRGFRSTTAVHRDALDGEALGFESFTQHAEVRLKQDPCLGGGGREVGNNCPLADLQFDAELTERGRLETHRDRASALVCEEGDALRRELGGGMERPFGVGARQTGRGAGDGSSCVERAEGARVGTRADRLERAGTDRAGGGDDLGGPSVGRREVAGLDGLGHAVAGDAALDFGEPRGDGIRL